jgi:Fur family peroxide stress response transcriptional regulator
MNNSKSKSQPKASKALSQKYSRQREEILSLVTQTTSHPTADWVYDKVRKRVPNISLGTVYRNLSLLVAEGKLQSLILEDGKVHYDGNTSEHYHFIDKRTGKVLDFAIDLGHDVLETFNRKTGLKADSYKIEFYGNSK